jgi:two-component system sensor histidine kinase HydH
MRWLAERWQVVVAILLFAGSLGALLVNSFAAGRVPSQELEARNQLRTAAVELAAAVRPVVGEMAALGPVFRPLPEVWHLRLAVVVQGVLAGYPGAEGGCYFAEGDQFAGFAHPTSLAPIPPGRRDPPPLETAVIRAMARAVLEKPEGSPTVEIHDVPPSRVAAATVAVEDHPARSAVWVMVRLRGPEQQLAELRRFQVAAVLGLAGVILSLLLAAGLARGLRRARVRQEELRDELRRAEHLAALGRLLAGVAHEVRNPLAALRSTVQLWQRLPDQARTPESLAAVLRAVDRLNDLVGRLLLFARSGHEERRLVDFNRVVVDVFALLQAQADNQAVTLKADLDPDLPRLFGSAPALQQVVQNLAVNALQAMPTGGVVVCRTRARSTTAIELLVADTGPGIAPAERGRLFEPFHTTRPDGTGLGLALCREIVHQHEGHIDLDPDVVVGATFRILLPVRGRDEVGIEKGRTP